MSELHNTHYLIITVVIDHIEDLVEETDFLTGDVNSLLLHGNVNTTLVDVDLVEHIRELTHCILIYTKISTNRNKSLMKSLLFEKKRPFTAEFQSKIAIHNFYRIMDSLFRDLQIG